MNLAHDVCIKSWVSELVESHKYLWLSDIRSVFIQKANAFNELSSWDLAEIQNFKKILYTCLIKTDLFSLRFINCASFYGFVISVSELARTFM